MTLGRAGRAVQGGAALGSGAGTAQRCHAGAGTTGRSGSSKEHRGSRWRAVGGSAWRTLHNGDAVGAHHLARWVAQPCQLFKAAGQAGDRVARDRWSAMLRQAPTEGRAAATAAACSCGGRQGARRLAGRCLGCRGGAPRRRQRRHDRLCTWAALTIGSAAGPDPPLPHPLSGPSACAARNPAPNELAARQRAAGMAQQRTQGSQQAGRQQRRTHHSFSFSRRAFSLHALTLAASAADLPFLDARPRPPRPPPPPPPPPPPSSVESSPSSSASTAGGQQLGRHSLAGLQGASRGVGAVRGGPASCADQRPNENIQAQTDTSGHGCARMASRRLTSRRLGVSLAAGTGRRLPKAAPAAACTAAKGGAKRV